MAIYKMHDGIDAAAARVRARLRDIDALEGEIAAASPWQVRALARRAVALARDGTVSAMVALEMSRDVARAADQAREIIAEAGLMHEEPEPKPPPLRVVDDS